MWRKTVYRRDNWRCQWPKCGLGVNTFPFRKIEAHHIEPWSKRPDLFYDLNNGITLCVSHHRALRGDEERYAAFLVGVLKSQGKLWNKRKQAVELKRTAEILRSSRQAARTAARRSGRRRTRTGRSNYGVSRYKKKRRTKRTE